MGSKPWHKLSALAAFGFLVMVGCNSGAQKSNDVAAAKAPPASPQTAQGAPNYNLPPMGQPFPRAAATPAGPTPANTPFTTASGSGIPPGAMPPPNGINNSQFNNTGFTPSPAGPSSANFPPPPGGINTVPNGGALPAFPPSNMNNAPPAPAGFATDRLAPIYVPKD